jgi:hypothetical protein
MTKEKMPSYVIAVQGEKADGRVLEQTGRLTIPEKILIAVWEYQDRHGRLPDAENALSEMNFIAEELRKRLGVNEKAMKVVPDDIIQ